MSRKFFYSIACKESDVTVYMRRGAFYDNPDITPAPSRRMLDEDYMLSSNPTADYEESFKDSEPLSNKWLKEDDAREYAEKLTKHKSNERNYSNKLELTGQQTIKSKTTLSTLPSTRRLSNIPIVIPTTIWRSGSSQIVLRKFLPLNDIKNVQTKEPDYLYKDDDAKYRTRPTVIEYTGRQIKIIQPDVTMRVDDIQERKLLPLNNGTTNSDDDQNDFIDEGNEDNIYKPEY